MFSCSEEIYISIGIPWENDIHLFGTTLPNPIHQLPFPEEIIHLGFY